MSLIGSVEEMIHDTLVKDPYRWLEDRSLSETEAWIQSQQTLCDEYFKSCPGLKTIERRVRDYLDVEVVDQPAFVEGQYFYRKRSTGQEQGSICTRKNSTSNERTLVDPSGEGRFISVNIYRISPDGSIMAYERKSGGTDQREIHFVEVNTGRILPNRIPMGYARGVVFARKGFFSCQEMEQDVHEHRIRYESFVEEGRVRDVFSVPRTKGSRLLLTGNAHLLGALWLRPDGSDVLSDFWIAQNKDDTREWTRVFHARATPYSPILSHDHVLVLHESNDGGTEVVELSQRGQQLGAIVPESRHLIRQLIVMQDRIFVHYDRDSALRLESRLLSGEQEHVVDLPAGGTIRILPVFTQNSERLFYSFESFDAPPAIYEYLPRTNTSRLWHQRAPINPIQNCEIKKITFSSQDGTQIPLTLVTATSAEVADSPRPTIMTSYGGFGASVTPRFSILAAIMMEFGFVFALPHIRGGGEFGTAWHEAGRQRNRQSSFDDFIAASQWLCETEVTTPGQLAIFGGSNSGLLVAAAATQRPELFRAVLCIAPLLDMLRYEYFDNASNWRREYGTVKDREDFLALHAYSPYHNVADGVDYPATLFVTGDRDDRCNPAHVRKMASRMQGSSSQRSAVIVDYSEERGHAPVLPLSVRIDSLTRRIAFLTRELGIVVPDGGHDECALC